MKRTLFSLFYLLACVLLFVTGFVYYSPHFFIKQLLKNPLEDLQRSGVRISLLEPEPRKTVLHLSIPALGIKDLLLEPKLTFQQFFPPSLSISVERNLDHFTIKETSFPVFNFRILLHQLFTATPVASITISGIAKLSQPLSFEIKANSNKLHKKEVAFTGEVSSEFLGSFVHGPFTLYWNLEKRFPYFNFEGTTKVFDTPGILNIELDSRPPSSQLSIKITNLTHPSLSSQLRFNIQTLAKILNEGTFSFLGQIEESSAGLKSTFNGHCDSTLSKCQLNYKFPLLFGKKLSPDKIWPELKKKAVGWEGAVQVTGQISNRNGKLNASSEIETHNLSGFLFEVPFININSTHSLNVFPTVTTKRNSKIHIDKIGDDLKLEKLRAQFNLGIQSAKVNEFIVTLAEGQVGLQPTHIPLKTYEGFYLFTLDNVNLTPLLRTFKTERLSGEGKLEGTIPIQIQNGQLLIKNALLRNKGPGKIKYIDESVSDVKEKIEFLSDFNDLLARGQQALAYKALSDFHYTDFEVRANRSSTQNLSVSLHLKGKNPNLAKGQPFEINLPISGNLESFILDSLVKSSPENLPEK